MRQHLAALGLFVLWGLSAPAQALDAACTPAKAVQTVWGANPVVSYLLAALAPEKLAGWNFPPPEQAQGYFPPETLARPVIGGWFGQGKTPNVEQLMALRPDLVLVSGVTVGTDKSLPLLSRLGLPACEIPLETLHDYPAGIRQAARAVGAEARGEAMADMAERLLQAMSSLPKQAAQPTLYYAQGVDGLASECQGSMHAEIIPLAGGQNVIACPRSGEKNRFGMVRVDFEQLVKLDPDFIVTQEVGFARKVKTDARWQSLRAVREGRVLLVPQVPFRWMDRPPSYMRLLAVHWLAQRIHPAPYALNLPEVTREFFQAFFQRRLDDSELSQILSPE